MKGIFERKKLKLFSGLLLAALLVCFIPGGIGGMKAEAAGKVYSIKYIADKGEYRYVEGNTWNDSTHRELYYMEQEIKDGDTIVVYGVTGEPGLNLNLSKISLGNFTAIAASNVVISVKSCTEFVATQSSVVSITGNVTTAHVYAYTKVNFNNDVSVLDLASVTSPTVSYTGDVNGLGNTTKVYKSTDGVERKAWYDFKPGTLVVTKGDVVTDPSNYSTTPNATATQSTTTPATTTPAANSEYDAVPKTGEVPVSTILFVIAGLFGIAGVAEMIMKKKLAK